MKPLPNQKILLILILTMAAVLRFYNLLFDAPYFFNPDERNMASAITQLRLPENMGELQDCFQLTNPKPKANSQQPVCNLNPHFFAYGQFPLYLAFFSGITTNALAQTYSNLITGGQQLITDNRPASPDGQPITNLTFPQAIFWLRFWSAVASTLTVFVVYLISKLLFDKASLHYSALLSALFSVFIPGLIQSAHFGTTESLLTFFFMIIIYLSIKLLSDSSKHQAATLVLFPIVMGTALGTKLSALPFAFPFFVALLIKLTKDLKSAKKIKLFLVTLLRFIFMGAFLLCASVFIYVLSSPFNFISLDDFRGSTRYEVNVARGDDKVFYTRQFEQTQPLLFQITHVFPFALGPVIFILGTIGFLLAVIVCIWPQKRKNPAAPMLGIVVAAFVGYLLPNAFVYAKWVRFMTPIFPLFSIFAIYVLISIRQNFGKDHGAEQQEVNKKQGIMQDFRNSFPYFLLPSFYFLAILPGLAFMSIYIHNDVRVTASRWIYDNIPSGAHVLSETANVIDIPLGAPTKQNYILHPVSFDFYNLDTDPHIGEKLIDELVASDYIFIPSRRLFANALKQEEKFPLLASYYKLLFSEQLGFTPQKGFSSFPTILPIASSYPSIPYNPSILHSFTSSIANGYLPDENAEETWTVFDHPVIRIYKKTKALSANDYRQLLKI